MEPTNIHGASLRTRMLQGAGLLVALTGLNMLVRRPQLDAPAWLLVAGIPVLTALGAVGGATYYATDGLRARGGWRKTAANVLTLLSYSLLAMGLLFAALASGM